MIIIDIAAADTVREVVENVHKALSHLFSYLDFKMNL